MQLTDSFQPVCFENLPPGRKIPYLPSCGFLRTLRRKRPFGCKHAHQLPHRAKAPVNNVDSLRQQRPKSIFKVIKMRAPQHQLAILFERISRKFFLQIGCHAR